MQKHGVFSRNHRKQFLFVKLTRMPLWLLSFLEKSIFSCFFFFFLSHADAKRGFSVSFTENIAYGDFLRRSEISINKPFIIFKKIFKLLFYFLRSIFYIFTFRDVFFT